MAAPHLIGIAGPSCAGKTELARWLAARLGAPVLNLDHYYVDMTDLPLKERAQRNFDEPAALESSLILTHVHALATGKQIEEPRYDFATHTRVAGGTLILPSPHVIIEGLFALYWPEVRALLGTRLFVEAPDEVCLARRTERDVRERGRTPESVRRQFEATVQPMARQYLLPTRDFADLVLCGADPIDSLGARVLAIL